MEHTRLDLGQAERLLPLVLNLPRASLALVATAALVSIVEITIPTDRGDSSSVYR